MADSLPTQVEQLKASLAGLTAQRATLGAAIVDPAIAALRQQITALEAQIAAVPPLPREQRRIITVLFSDVVDSTALAEKLDPEDWQRIIAQVQSTVGNIILDHHGTIAQYLGDGLLAFFGASETREADPENAVLAGLAIHSAVALLDLPFPIQIRVGIHTGPVFIGEYGTAGNIQASAFGNTVNIASRLQSSAPPRGVLISHDTYTHVRGVFQVTPLPPLSIKGQSEPVRTYLAQQAKPRPFRTVTRGVAGIQTRTVGREVECKQLQDAYLEAFENNKTVWAQLVGDAGVGKSRLIEDMRDWSELRPEHIRLLRARAYPGDSAQPLALVRRMWFDRFQITEDASIAEAEERWVERFQDLAHTDAVEPAHALGLLVGLPFNDSPYIQAMRNDPTQVKARALVVSRQLLHAIRRDYPAEILLEDLHWADTASWEWLTELLLGASDMEDNHMKGVFVLATARPSWKPPDSLRRLFGLAGPPSPGTAMERKVRGLVIELAPLSDDATRELAGELLQKVQGVPDQVLQLLVDRAEGIPYYAEELVNWFIDRGIIDKQSEPWQLRTDRLSGSPLPTTLQHLLLTRLSDLNQNERAALQRGAIFGRNFWTGGIEALGVKPAAPILTPLDARGLVHPQTPSVFQGQIEWSFHHNLLREVTYESVLKRERASLHHAAAQWLAEQAQTAGREDEFAGIIGVHLERAGDLLLAADRYLRAGDQARGQGASQEAEQFYCRALTLLPATDRDRRWQALRGRDQVLAILGQPETWRTNVQSLLDLAIELDRDDHRAEAFHSLAICLGNTGDSRGARQAAQDALSAAERAGDTVLAVQALSLRAQLEVRMGELEQGLASAEQALARARSLDESTQALALYRAAFCYGEQGDLSRALVLLLEQIELTQRLGNRHMEASGRGNLAVVYMGLGLYQEAQATMQRALELDEALDARRGRAYDLMNLGEIAQLTGQLDTARHYQETALIAVTAAGDEWGKAAVLFNLGIVLLDSGNIPAATGRFVEARTIFEQIDALTNAFESRAGEARCALAQGRLEEAGQQANQVWAYLQEHGSAGLTLSLLAYVVLAEVFQALGEVEKQHGVVQAAYHELAQRAERITVPEWRQSFLENDPYNRAILDMYKDLKAPKI
ncbi:MAG: adenylate/guanylate cyclase domain-containing protein [Anaerolineae bacterium]